ncbi:hypothetical protein M422DRAFT_784305 [Sphaerobolus stellatus SS14]|uniref:DUF6534 domain-containing protein n=1 Tax=Sphaerobolus stellatus (strain SS14) TaxID=990650 RepID=A0A0C9UKF8_SPHS4|nr:hypothetical protein M422DRAFT_784305 [Sphaerobolus stellatus SS14]
MPSSSPLSQFRQSNGLMFIAMLEAVSLWSVLCLQGFIYFTTYIKDPIALKLMVLWTLLLATAHVIMIAVKNYTSLIIQFGDIGNLNTVDPLVLFLLLPTTLIALTVQSFFIWRIWIFNGKKFLFPCILLFGELFQLAGNIFTLYQGSHITSLSALFAVDHVMLAYYGVAAAADVAISIAMIYLLSQRRLYDGGASPSKRSADILHRLIVLSVNSGLWTAIFAIGVLILSVVYQGTMFYSIFYFPLAHLYANSFLANLNARNFIRGQNNRTAKQSTFDRPNVFRLNPTVTSTSSEGEQGQAQILITTDTVKHTDNESDVRNNDWNNDWK